jgi:hypothetical protein
METKKFEVSYFMRSGWRVWKGMRWYEKNYGFE